MSGSDRYIEAAVALSGLGSTQLLSGDAKNETTWEELGFDTVFDRVDFIEYDEADFVEEHQDLCCDPSSGSEHGV
jgi:hypothetical protein